MGWYSVAHDVGRYMCSGRGMMVLMEYGYQHTQASRERATLLFVQNRVLMRCVQWDDLMCTCLNVQPVQIYAQPTEDALDIRIQVLLCGMLSSQPVPCVLRVHTLFQACASARVCCSHADDTHHVNMRMCVVMHSTPHAQCLVLLD